MERIAFLRKQIADLQEEVRLLEAQENEHRLSSLKESFECCSLIRSFESDGINEWETEL